CTADLASPISLFPYAPPCPPDLHSLPTRRSSDLDTASRIEGEGNGRRAPSPSPTGEREREREPGSGTNHAGRAQERDGHGDIDRSEEHTSELQSRENLVCRLLLEKKKQASTCMHP